MHVAVNAAAAASVLRAIAKKPVEEYCKIGERDWRDRLFPAHTHGSVSIYRYTRYALE